MSESAPDERQFDDYILRAADEGVPIGALKRIFKPSSDRRLRLLITTAVNVGRLAEQPKEDWPLRVARSAREPTTPPHVLGGDDADTILRLARCVKTTKQEGNILLVVLRRGQASREQLHAVIEANRTNSKKSTDMKIVDVVVCKLRKKLAPLGLEFNTIHSLGYEMSEEHRAKLLTMIKGV